MPPPVAEPLMPKWQALAFYVVVGLAGYGWYQWDSSRIEVTKPQDVQDLMQVDPDIPVRAFPGQRVDIGEFEVQSGSVLIGDPAYDDDESLLVNVTNVATGPWIAWFTKVEQQGERASELVAIRRGSNAQDWKVVDGFGVDSGQAGIFDRAHFYDVDIVPVDLKVSDPFLSQQNRWYAMCCETTLSKIAGTIPFGVVSSSGMGDGMYIALAAEGPQGIEGLKLVFLDLEQE